MSAALQNGRLRRAAWIGALVILALNIAISSRLFRLEYSANLGSNEGQFIALARGIAEHPTDLAWWPEWSCGLPFQNTYLPLVPLKAASWSRITGVSPALAFHQVGASFYCLGPVFLYLMALVITRWTAASFAAAALFSVFSPCALLPAIGADVGGIWNLRRLQILAHYGEAPITAALALVPVAILFLYLALSRRKLRYGILAAAFFGFTALANAFGIVILAAAAAAMLGAWDGEGFRRRVAYVAAMALGAYVWISPALPPSVLMAIRLNSPTVDGDYHFTLRSLFGVAILAVGYAVLWAASGSRSRSLRFFLLFAWLTTGIVTLGVLARIYVVPQPHRYQIAMDMGICLLAGYCAAQMAARIPKRAIPWAAALIAIPFLIQARHAVRYAHSQIQSVDIEKTAPYRTAKWIEANLPGKRVMAGGSYSFYLNDFSDTPQLHGGQDPMLPNFMLRIAVFTIYSGMNAGARDGEIATLWLKALGARAVTVPGPRSEEYYKPFADPKKFDGILPVLWREGDDTIYAVPARSDSLAHALKPDDLVRHPPVNGLDTAELERYVAALKSPAYAELRWRWTSRHSAVIDGPIRPGEVISVQETYHPGWMASANGQAQRVAPDGLGLLTIEPTCQGPCSITLSFDGGAEWRVTSGLSFGLMLLTGVLALRRARVFRKSGNL